MNPSTSKAIDRLMRQMSRPPRQRKSRFSIAPVLLGLGLVMCHQLLTRLVPMVWSSMLPGGLRQAQHFRGWPGLVFACALYFYREPIGSMAILAAIGGVGLFFTLFVRPLRPLVWLMVAGVTGVNAGIVYVTLRTAVEATAQQALLQ